MPLRVSMTVPMVLLEREAEFQVLREALDAAVRGEGRVVLLTGEAGGGKSSVVRAFVADIGDRARVWFGACEDLSTPRTLGPFRDMARQTGGAIREAFAAAPDPGAMVEPLLDELAYPLQPTVVVVEDLHWADDATLDLIRMVARRNERLYSLLLLTYRDDELTVDHPVQGLLGSLAGPATRRLALSPLSVAAVRQLVGDSRAPAEVHRVTGGNPFFVTEVLGADDHQVPTTVRDAVRARLARLAPAARTVLELLAMVPTGVDLALVEKLLGTEASHLAEAEALGVLEANHERVWFRHELARRALEDTVPNTARVWHHRRLVAALVEAGGDPSRILHHAVAAGDADRVIAYGPAAARQAARAGSHRQAASYYQQVLAFSDQLAPDVSAQLVTRYAYELYHLRRFGDAAAQAREAVAAWERLGQDEQLATSLVTLSRATYWAGDPREARAAAERAVRLLEPGGPSAGLASAYIALTHVLMQADDVDAIAWADRAIALGTDLGREDIVLQARSYRGTVRMGRRQPGGEEDVLDSLRMAQARDDDVAVTRICSNLVRDLLRLGRLAEADRYVDLGLAAASRAEFVHGQYMLRARRAELAAQFGRWDDAEQTIRSLLAAHPDTGVNGSLTLAWLGRLAARRADGEAVGLLERAWQLAAPTGELQWAGPVAAARVEAAWLAGDRDGARRAANLALVLADRTEHPWYRGELRRYLARAGEAVGTAPSCPDAWALGLSGDWHAAAAAWEDAGNPYERALELAEVPDEAAVREAIGLLDRLGATAAAGLARRRLRALGVTRIPRGPQTRTRQNPAGLTARQVDVLALLADGLTNAEIADRLVLSTRTVDHHVAAILGKLGVSSRRDAARAAVERGIIASALEP